MPKSRDRKKRRIQHVNINTSILDKLVDKICSCPECHNERIYLEYFELPESQKVAWKNEDLEKIDYFLYCMSCHIFSAINKHC
ncbi:MAG: hypothetical protein JWN56_867 [Sphingobacteriales bacterium]|nr:hypothetical protein [Sphingobacteriales bacterium]